MLSFLTVFCILSLAFLALPDIWEVDGRLSVTYVNSTKTNKTARRKRAYRDTCALAKPETMFHFDSAEYVSKEFANAAEKSKEMPVSARVFTAFFKDYIFDPNSDVVLNLTTSDTARAMDIRNAVPLIQNAIREFKRDDTIKVTRVSFGYSHMCRLRGLRYVFHVGAISSQNKEIARKSRQVAAIQRPFDGSCRVRIADISDETMRQPVYLVVPYSNRPNRLKWFLHQFDQLRERHMNLVLVLAASTLDSAGFHEAKKLVRAMKFSGNVHIVPVKGDRFGYFSRAVAIRDASKRIPDDGLMFISDIDMQIFRPFFENCRMNTIRGHQVYFPVFYTLFAGAKHIDRRRGYWRSSSYGMSCIYKSDFDAVAAYEHAEDKFLGWGEEDVHLVKAFSAHKDYEVFRAVEPSLRHKWHMKHCEKNTPSYDSCLTMLYDQLGTAASLGKYLLQREGIDVQQFLSKVADEDDVLPHANTIQKSGDEYTDEVEAAWDQRRMKLRKVRQERKRRLQPESRRNNVDAR